jgi:hypothetical protein
MKDEARPPRPERKRLHWRTKTVVAVTLAVFAAAAAVAFARGWWSFPVR